MSRLWIVRHGNTFEPDEPPRRIGARTDLPLVESGRAQARALAAWFDREGVRFDRILVAPLRRTRETAATIAVTMTVEIADVLTEIDYGDDEDRLETEVVARIGAAALAAWDSGASPPPGWRVDAERRIAGWKALLAGIAPEETVLAITSNGAARFVLDAGLFNIPPARKLRTGAWGLVTHGTADSWRVIEWDCRP